MMESWREPEFTVRWRVRMGVMGAIGTWLGVIFAVLGIIGEAIDATIGFEPIFWLVLAVVSLLFGLSCWLGYVFGMYLHVIETKSKKD